MKSTRGSRLEAGGAARDGAGGAGTDEKAADGGAEGPLGGGALALGNVDGASGALGALAAGSRARSIRVGSTPRAAR
jgi:hypothetical protein